MRVYKFILALITFSKPLHFFFDLGFDGLMAVSGFGFASKRCDPSSPLLRFMFTKNPIVSHIPQFYNSNLFLYVLSISNYFNLVLTCP